MAEIDVTRIAGNIGAMNSLNSLKAINNKLAINQTRLSSGMRINSAADDPAGLSIATKMLSRSEGLKVALNNIGDTKNLLAVAESGLGRINDILVQMRNKAETAASDTMSTTERDAIKTQLAAYAAQIDDIVDQTKWNDQKLIDGTTGTLRFQTGADSGEFTEMSAISDMHATVLGIVDGITTSASSSVTDGTVNVIASTAEGATLAGVDELASGNYTAHIVVDNTADATSYIQLKDASGNLMTIDADGTAGGLLGTSLGFDVTADQPINLGNGLTITLDAAIADGTYDKTVTYTRAGAYQINANDAATFSDYMDKINDAMTVVNENMATVGALTGRLTFKEDQVSAAQINVEAAYNRIMNADMAEEQVNASKYQILQQTATAMLAQANTAPQFLLQLFR